MAPQKMPTLQTWFLFRFFQVGDIYTDFSIAYRSLVVSSSIHFPSAGKTLLIYSTYLKFEHFRRILERRMWISVW